MTKNAKAVLLKVIGFLSIFGGMAIAVALHQEFSYEYVTLGIIAIAMIIGLLFISFGEVVELLQKSTDNQRLILETLTAPHPSSKSTPSGSPSSLHYTTNPDTTASNGNCGTYAYKRTISTDADSCCDSYCIINFDLGFIYLFDIGGADNSLQKIPIVQGTLNDIVVAYSPLGSDAINIELYFKDKYKPKSLILIEDGKEYEYTATDLELALELTRYVKRRFRPDDYFYVEEA